MTSYLHEIAMALCQFQDTTNWLKYLKRNLEDILRTPMEKQLEAFRDLMLTHYGDHGMIETLERRIDDCEAMCGNTFVARLLDDLKSEMMPELSINNDTIEPISVYKGGTLVGVVRNSDALFNVQRQIKEKHLTGYCLQFAGNVYKFDENGILEEEPATGYLVNGPTLELLKELAKKD